MNDTNNAIGLHDGEADREGAMAKADLYKLANYSLKLFKTLQDDDQLEGWVQAKITKAADYIASVYHYLEYEMKFSEYGQHLDNMETLSEGQRYELQKRLFEAKGKMKELKKVQAEKLKGEKMDEGMTEPCGHCGGMGHVEKKIPEETKEKIRKYKTLVKATKAAHKRMDKNHNGIDDRDEGLNESTMSPGEKAHHHATEYAKHHKTGNLEMAMHHKQACEECGGMIKHGPMGNVFHQHMGYNEGKMYECGNTASPMTYTAEGKKAKPDYIEKESMKKAAMDAKKNKQVSEVFDSDEKIGTKKKTTHGVATKTAQGMKHEKSYGNDDSDIEDDKPAKKTTKKKVSEEQKTMSRFAKGVMKYGKDGMQALAKASKEGKDLDKVRDKYDKYDESKMATQKKDKPMKGDKVADEGGNAFVGALKKAREHGDKEMKVGDKTVPVKPGKAIPEGQSQYGNYDTGGISKANMPMREYSNANVGLTPVYEGLDVTPTQVINESLDLGRLKSLSGL